MVVNEILPAWEKGFQCERRTHTQTVLVEEEGRQPQKILHTLPPFHTCAVPTIAEEKARHFR